MQISKYIQLNRLWISVVDLVNLVNKFNTFSKSSHENKDLPLYCTFRTERKRLYFKVKGQKADFSDLCFVFGRIGPLLLSLKPSRPSDAHLRQ